MSASSTDRDAAATLLKEAVFASRAKQSGVAGLSAAAGESPDAPGNCGLGKHALVVLERSETARAAFDALFPAPLDEARASAVSDLVSDWVERQDALDRKRNHFLRDFRNEHGYDRRAYDDALRTRFEAGLDEVNALEDADRERAVSALLDLTADGPAPLPSDSLEP